MNTSQLKRFAATARRKLMEQVGARLEYILSTDSAEIRNKSRQVGELKVQLAANGKPAMVEKIAYTWFNRLMALRFMDVNGYTSPKAVTPAEGMLQPEVLEDAKRGQLQDGLNINANYLNDLLDGRIASNNPQNEAYRHLLVAVCNSWHTAMPFLFERIDDFTELLMPDDLLSDDSIVSLVRSGMNEEDCQNVEIIGWLYQFYIAEKKDQVFASKAKVKAEDIPAATQLFTPRWIVEYMVQNTVGKLWVRNKKGSALKTLMPYYINSPSENETTPLTIAAATELQLLDPACGSGHILVYGFDLLAAIYEEEGYYAAEIPRLILENNLIGIDIDERAAQLSAFALTMKARAYFPRFFRNPIEPRITALHAFPLDDRATKELFSEAGLILSEALRYDLELMRSADNFGSLIIPHNPNSELEQLKKQLNASPLKQQLLWQGKTESVLNCLTQLITLGAKYTCVVANPPYMGGNMNLELNNFVKTNYPASKSDLMACFMESTLLMLKPQGYLGMINQHSWMFLTSYEALREKLIKEIQFDTMLHLGSRTFPEIGGEVVQNTAFTFFKHQPSAESIYIRLVDERTSEGKSRKTLDAIAHIQGPLTFLFQQNSFEKIPGTPIAYWLSANFIKCFDHDTVGKVTISDGQTKTGDNDKYIRAVWEVSSSAIGVDKKWVFHPKGGAFRRWYGNTEHVVNWSAEARQHYRKDRVARIIPEYLWWKKGISWTLITSGKQSFRDFDEKSIFNLAAPTVFFLDEHVRIYTLGLLNTPVAEFLFKVFNPTLNCNIGEIQNIPLIIESQQNVESIVQSCLQISKLDWDAQETSWDFDVNELIKHRSTELIADAYDSFVQFWTTKFCSLHKNEERLNELFIETYGLRKELTPHVSIADISILQEILHRNQLEQVKLLRNKTTGEVESYEGVILPINKQEVVKQFVSYAVGCMFGRYSLQKDGLILSTSGQTLTEYMELTHESIEDREVKLKLSTQFLPDTDGIIPVLDDDYFQDDIVSQFKRFLLAAFGEKAMDSNLRFIEDALGKDIRQYFAKEFYSDHIKRYGKRPIYWMISSPRKGFNALVYLHRYTPDTVSLIRNQYLNPFMEKLKANKEHLIHIKNSASATPAEKTKGDKRIAEIDQLLVELAGYEREVIYPLATEHVALDLDDGVLINYNKLGAALQEVKGLTGAVKTLEALDQESN